MGDVEQRLERFVRQRPRRGRGAYVAAGAVIVGDVRLGAQSSVWHNAVLRGDINRIVVGHHTNIQDNAVLHVADAFACEVGNWVTVGHAAILHACRVEDEVLIGMGAIVMDGARIGRQSIVGAGALVTQGVIVAPGTLVLGNPARVIRKLTAVERRAIKGSAAKYVAHAAYCLRQAANPCPK